MHALLDWAARWSYKPGSQLHVDLNQGLENCRVHLVLEVPSSREPTMRVPVPSSLVEPVDLNADGLSDFYAPSKMVRVERQHPRMIQVTTVRFLDANEVRGSQQAFYQWVWDNLVVPLETHEMAEWFKVDGEVYDDPHHRSFNLNYREGS